jgi:antirestriction protein ArdC
MAPNQASRPITNLYADVTDRIILELEAGRLPWVQPWDGWAAVDLPRNAVTGRRYSGINILFLWAALSEQGYGSQRWMTYRQAQAIGANVRRGEQGTTVVYADRFTPRGKEGAERSAGEGEEQRQQVAFLKRFTVFNVEQIEALPASFNACELALSRDREPIPEAEALIASTGADFRIGGDRAYYHPDADYVRVPPQQAYPDQINWYRTALHELGHWTGHGSRLDRLKRGMDRDAYGREELVAEMCSAFVCAELGIVPTVRHADYIGAWLAILREDNKAIFRAASQASKAADWLLACRAVTADAQQEAA